MSALSWLGVPWTKHDNEEYQLGCHKVQGHFAENGTLQSGMYEQAITRYKRLEWRRRVKRRIAALVSCVGVVAAAASAYSHNRALDAIGRSLGTLTGGQALLAFATTRRSSSD